MKIPKKRCPQCDVLKPLTEFYSSHRACKKCKSEYYFKRREAILKQQKEYRTRCQLFRIEWKNEQMSER